MNNLLLNKYAKYERPISKPYNIFYNGRTNEDSSLVVIDDISNHINTIDKSEPYNLHYETLANVDLALDLFHIGILYDREIHTNRIKIASNTSDNLDTNRTQRGAVYDVTNNSDELVYFPLTPGMTNDNIWMEIIDGICEIKFAAHVIPQGGFGYNTPTGVVNNNYEGLICYKSKTPVDTDISLIYNTDFKHWDISYNNGTIEHVDWICASGGKVTGQQLLDQTNTHNWEINQNTIFETIFEEVSNNQGIDWKVSSVEKGVVYIQQHSAADLSFTFGFSNIFERDTIANHVERQYKFNPPSPWSGGIIKGCYWLDIINQYSCDKTYNSNTNTFSFRENNIITQVPLIDIQIQNTTAPLIENLTIENPILNGGLKPIFGDISGYSLSTRYNTELFPSLKSIQRESMQNNKYLYDELYYGHDWSRVQKYDISSDLQEVADFGDIYDISDDRLDQFYGFDISRSSFNYKFPYLFYKCEKNNQNEITDALYNYIKIFYNTLTEKNFNDVSFCDASSVISTLGVGYAEQDMSAGFYDFDGIDLMKCSVEMQEDKYNNITTSPFVDISCLGIHDLPTSYLFKGYYYGYYDTSNTDISIYPNINRDEKYLVFKFKEPSSYVDTTNDISTNYLLFDGNNYRENVPVGGDPYRMIFGLQENYDASGYMIINADIAERLYIPIEMKPKTGFHISSSMSNNTNVFILDISVNENNFLGAKTETVPKPGKSAIIERNNKELVVKSLTNTEIGIIDFGIENKPIKFMHGYNIADSLIKLHDYNTGNYKLQKRLTPWSSVDYDLNDEFYFHYPLTGKVNPELTSQWYVGEEKYIIETSFNTLVSDEVLLKYSINKNLTGGTAYNSSVIEITDLSMALICPNQGTKSYTYIPSYYFSESTKNVLNPIRNRVDFTPSADISYGLIDKDKTSRISSLTKPNRDIQNKIAKGITQSVVVNIAPNEFTSNGITKYELPIISNTYSSLNPITYDNNSTIQTENAILAENYALNTTITAKHLIQTNNITIQTNDKASIDINLPFSINYNIDSVNLADLSFIIIGQSSLGYIEPSEIVTSNGNASKFIPITQYLGGINSFSDAVLTDELHYKILYNGVEYTEWNNTITINIINQYDNPSIYNKTYNIFKGEQIDINLVTDEIFLIDDAYSNLEVIDLIGPFNGKKTTNFNNGNFSLTYNPDTNFIGVDYIFFKIKTSSGDNKSNEGHITFIITEREPEPEPEPIIETEYDICVCRKEVVNTNIETAGNNPKITLAELGSMRSINMRHYRKKRFIRQMPEKAIINQNMRSSNNLRNF